MRTPTTPGSGADGWALRALGSMLLVGALALGLVATLRGTQEPGTDLVPAVSTYPEEVPEGQPVTIAVRVHNRGTQDAGASLVTIEVEALDQTRVFSIGYVPAGESREVSWTVIFSAEGRYRIRAVADSSRVVVETDEDNNDASTWVRVRSGLLLQ